MDDKHPLRNDTLSPTDAIEINRICDRHEADWRSGGRPLIENHIANIQEPVRSALLRELLATELECRQSAGERPRLAEYRARFPDHIAIVEAAFARGDEPFRGPAARYETAAVPKSPDRGPLGSGSPGQTSGPDPAAIDRYTVIERLGQGGFGRVYLAQDEELDRPVAIKVPKPERVARPEDVEAFLDEARILASLDHPHIVPVYDVGRTEDGLCFVVSKFIEGSDLARKDRGTPPWLPRIGGTGRDGRRSPALRPHTRAGPPGRQARQHPDRCRGQALRSRFRARTQGRGLRQAVRDSRNARLHEPRAGPWRGASCRWAIRHLQPRRGFLRAVDRATTVLAKADDKHEARTELLDLIATAEARPPRQIDDTIPKELERICLKAIVEAGSRPVHHRHGHGGRPPLVPPNRCGNGPACSRSCCRSARLQAPRRKRHRSHQHQNNPTPTSDRSRSFRRGCDPSMSMMPTSSWNCFPDLGIGTDCLRASSSGSERSSRSTPT